eukprot:2427332-Prymnesium_polylepis.1
MTAAEGGRAPLAIDGTTMSWLDRSCCNGVRSSPVQRLKIIGRPCGGTAMSGSWDGCFLAGATELLRERATSGDKCAVCGRLGGADATPGLLAKEPCRALHLPGRWRYSELWMGLRGRCRSSRICGAGPFSKVAAAGSAAGGCSEIGAADCCERPLGPLSG